MIKLYLVGLLLIFGQIVLAQEWKWVYESYGKAYNGIIDIVKDSKDNIIVLLNYSQNSMDHGFYICDSIYHSTTSDNGLTLIKLDPNGYCLWSLNLVGAGSLSSHNIAIDKDDNIIIPGYLVGAIDIDGQVIGYPGTAFSSGVIIKLNSKGELIRYKIFGPSSRYRIDCRFICTDSNNNIYTDIYFTDDSILIGNVVYYRQQDSTNIGSILVKMDPKGTIIWSKPISTKSFGNSLLIFNLIISTNDNLIISGIFSDEWMSIDRNRINCSLPYQSHYELEAFIGKLNANTGELVWLKSFGGPRNDYVWEIKSDSKDNLYANTSFYSPKFAIGQDTIYHFGERNGGLRINNALISFDQNGNLRWYKQFESLHSEGSGSYLAIDKEDKLWINTLFAAKMDWYGYTFNPRGVLDCAYLKFNSEGTLIDTFSLGGENNLMATGPIEIMNNGDLVIGNYFTGDSLRIGENSIQCDSWDYRFRKKAYDSFLARFTPKQGVGTKNPNSTIGISIHPNPARDLIQIRFDEDLSADGSVEILTTTGTAMKSLLISKGSTSTTVDVRDWPAGVYFVRYRNIEGRSNVEQVVVE